MADVLDPVPLTDVNPELRQRVTQASDGRAAKALRAERQSVLEELRATGVIRTATIVNFNPVWLKTTSSMPYKVPPFSYPGLPADMQITVEHGGRKFTGAYITVDQPFLYPKIRGTKRDDGTGDDVGDFMIKHVLPLGIVLDFWQHYNKSSEQPVAMGGILVFEGTRHVMEKRPKTIKVPVAKLLPNGDRAYFTQENELDKVLESVFEEQRKYTGYMIRQARAFHADEAQRKNITDQGHRVWGQYALDKGWGMESKEEWMFDSTTTEIARCESCGLPRRETKAHFCQGCNAPYDAYGSFMAGRPVPEQYLYTLNGKQLEDVKKEMRRRKALFADEKA